MKKFNNYSLGDLWQMVSDVNAYNGALEHLEVYSMEELNEIMHGFDPIDFALKIFYGDFNPNHDYFYFNGYANLVSLSDYDFRALLLNSEDEIIEEYNAINESLKEEA